jgi:antitoxin (DNA-binding transcriptional repressor) of toxin-antitoxin stability system
VVPSRRLSGPLSRLWRGGLGWRQAALRGEEIVITNRNRPVPRLVPAAPIRERRVFGSASEAFERSGLTREDIARALAPMSEDELRERGID